MDVLFIQPTLAMPVSHHVDINDKILHTVWEGEATDEACVSALQNYIETLQTNPDYKGYKEILDFRKAEPLNVTIKGLLAISNLASDSEAKNDIRKLALVVNTDIAFNFANLYVFYRNLSRNNFKKIKIFKHYEEAYNWVLSDA